MRIRLSQPPYCVRPVVLSSSHTHPQASSSAADALLASAAAAEQVRIQRNPMFAASDPAQHRSSIIAVNHTGSVTGLSALSPMSAVATAMTVAPFVVDTSVPVDLDEAYICVGIMRAAMNCVQQFTDAEEAGAEAVSEQAAQVCFAAVSKRQRGQRGKRGGA